MTDTKDDGGPFHPPFKVSGNAALGGASFRAVVAMHAMAGLLGSHNFRITFGAESSAMSAKRAVEAADALIAELKK